MPILIRSNAKDILFRTDSFACIISLETLVTYDSSQPDAAAMPGRINKITRRGVNFETSLLTMIDIISCDAFSSLTTRKRHIRNRLV